MKKRLLLTFIITAIAPAAHASDGAAGGIVQTLSARIEADPFNLVTTVIFLLAIVHTFLTSRFTAAARRWEVLHTEKITAGKASAGSVHFGAGILHFLGDVDVVFGLWAVVLGIFMVYYRSWNAFIRYVGEETSYSEVMFVVVVMTVVSTRPILKFAELLLWRGVKLLGGSLRAWWFCLLTAGPLLGSFITQPAAMTITAHLLAGKFYDLNPGTRLKYATLGLLFVNISVGGLLTDFSALPVMMVTAPWGWDGAFVAANFGWKAVVGILASTGLYFFIFRGELAELEKNFTMESRKIRIKGRYVNERALSELLDKIQDTVNRETGFLKHFEEQCEEIKAMVEKKAERAMAPDETGRILLHEVVEASFEEIKQRELHRNVPGLLHDGKEPLVIDPDWDNRPDKVPVHIMAAHLLFLAWTMAVMRHPVLFVAGLLFLLGFAQVTPQYQNRINLKEPLLVGFFLGGLVIHSGLQAWWLAPMLEKTSAWLLMAGATSLSAFNDNAAITYLCTLVPGFDDQMKYLVVAGAVTGGGLTVIANAPNPAGQTILKRYFRHGIWHGALLLAALPPTLITGLIFFMVRT